MSSLKSKTLSILAGLALAGGCATAVHEDVKEQMEEARTGPESLPQRNITDFADALRCMDNMLIVYGMGDIVVLMEDLEDNTEKVKAGTRDMLISAVSDMTRRSQAIQVIAFGKDTGNLVSFMDFAGQKSVYENVPPFDIRGSISQLDKDIVRKQSDIGASAKGTVSGTPFGVGVGASASSSGTVLGLDLSIITTHNMAVLPGVTSRNSVVIYRAGDAIDADAFISKLGVNYSVITNKSEGLTQGLRALIELSAIELFGKLLKVPYWNCLGIDPSQEEIRTEIGDWFYSMSTTGLMTQYMKTQLYIRGYFNGQINNQIDPGYQEAVLAYRQRLNLPSTPVVDLDFFEAFLNNTPTSVPPSRLAYARQKKTEEAKAARKESGSTVSKDEPIVLEDEPLVVGLSANKPGSQFSPGEPVSLRISSNTAGFLYCYFRDATGSIVRFFPNRFIRGDGFIGENSEILLPGEMPFSITTDDNGRRENVTCFVTTRNIFTELPASMRKQDFEPLDVVSDGDIVATFQKLTGGRMGYQSLGIGVN